MPDAPDGFASAPLAGRGFPNLRFTLQIGVEDCTGCELCVEACPARSLEAAGTRAINMEAKAPLLERERRNLAFFETLPDNKPAGVDATLVRGVQYLTPLFEYSGACAGCGETPYLRLLTQLFGDRLLVANATGCSSIYGGNLPTTPWSVNAQGRGPAWANSLFEDNAEFGLGYRLSLDKHREQAEELLQALAPGARHRCACARLLGALQVTQDDVDAQRSRVRRPRTRTGTASPIRAPGNCARSPRTWCARASGSSAATAGRTTSATADSITCWHPDATSISWCWTPRCTRTPVDRRRRRRRARASRNSRPAANGAARRTSA